MTDETKNQNSKDNSPEAEEPEMSLEDLDSLLAEEDPSFASEFSQIKSEKFDADLDVEDFDAVDASLAPAPTPTPPSPAANSRIGEFVQNRKTNLVANVKGAIPFLLSLVGKIFGRLFGSINYFFRMPLKQKAIVLLVIGLSGLVIVLLMRGLGGSLLPNFELKFLTSLGDVADRSFKIEKGESFEDFDNPLRHPDFVVLVERLVVNLRPSESSESPMGMFEFYVEASTQEGAIEINERQKEIRDLMARTLEGATHGELATSEGKDKMKLTLRRELNTLLTQGRVRRVFFKTIILKP